MSISEFRATTQAELTLALADLVESELKEAVAVRGQASLVVSGGSTPKPLFAELSQRLLPWCSISVTLADERWVDTASKDSNEAMIRETLLRGSAAEANFVPLKNSAPTAFEGQAECQRAVTSISRPFDLVVLGMGDDGHTASLFPDVSGAALDYDSIGLCQSINPPSAPHERMTLTAPALLNSRKLILHIVGEKKWQVYRDARSEGPANELPVRVALHQNRVPVVVYWSP